VKIGEINFSITNKKYPDGLFEKQDTR